MDFNSGLKFLAFVAIVGIATSAVVWIQADEKNDLYKVIIAKRYFWTFVGLFVALGFLVAIGVGLK